MMDRIGHETVATASPSVEIRQIPARRSWLQIARTCLVLTLSLLLADCETPAPTGSHRLAKSAEITGGRVITLLIDTCVEELTISGDDYFLVAEARAGANALLNPDFPDAQQYSCTNRQNLQ
jgi:hypothetical protein